MIFSLHFNRWKHYLFSKNIRLSLLVPKVTNVMWLLLRISVYVVSDLILHFSIISAVLLHYIYFRPYYLLTRFVFLFILYLYLSLFSLCLSSVLPLSPFFFISWIFVSLFLSYSFICLFHFCFVFLSLFSSLSLSVYFFLHLSFNF